MALAPPAPDIVMDGTSSAVDSKALADTVAVTGGSLGRDAGIWAIGVACVVVVVPYLVPVLSPEAFSKFAENGGYFPVLAAALFAVLWGLRTRSKAERRFWGFVAVAITSVLIVRVGYIEGVELVEVAWGTLIDAFYVLFYVALMLALWWAPQSRQAISTPQLGGLRLVAGTVVLVSLCGYFVYLPLEYDPDIYASWVPSLMLYVVLDLFLVLWCIHRWSTAPTKRWKVTHGLLALAAGQWVVTDTLEWLWTLDLITLADYGEPWDLVWYVPYLCLGLAARLSLSGESSSPPEPVSAEPALPVILLYPLILPALHFATSILGLNPEGQRRPQEVLVLISLFVLLGLGYAHQRTLQRRTEEVAERQRVIEERLTLSQKMEALGGLAGGIAHDFNNVLAAIMGYAEVIREEVPEDSEARADVNKILVAADRGKALVAQILAFSQMRQLEKRPLEIGALVEEALVLMRPAKPSGVNVRPLVRTGKVVVNAEENQIHQVVVNLVSNAYHAMEREGGDLIVEVYSELGKRLGEPGSGEDRDGDRAVISVLDSGPGISTHDRERIFDPFFTTKRIGRGTGLGLAAVHRIVASHGGTVEVNSVLGEGSEFKVTLPLAARGEAPAPLRASPTMISASTDAGPRRVMVVDDEVAVAMVIERNLQASGYQVVTFNDPEEALATFRDGVDAFDALVTDQRMPGMTGIELANSMRALSPGLPVLLVSGYWDAQMRDVAQSAGMREVLAKPFKSDELLRAVASLFADVVQETP